MGMENGPAIISAASGLIGAVIGSLIVVGKDVVSSKLKRKKEATYLAAIVASHLERFASGCLCVAQDDGTEQGWPAGKNGEYVPTTKAPQFQPLDIDVEWRVLPSDLMYAILRLPDNKVEIESNLSGIREYAFDPPDHKEYFWARRRHYAELGLHASKLSRKLCSHAKMPIAKPKPDGWNLDQDLKGIIERIDSNRDAYERYQAETLKRSSDTSEPIR